MGRASQGRDRYRRDLVAALARSLLFDAGRALAAFEFGKHLLKGHVARREHDQQMIEDICRLGRQFLAAAGRGRDDRLNRFLAELFGGLSGTRG